MLLSRAADIRQSDGFAKLQRLCHTLIFCHLFLYIPFVSYLVLFLGYISCFSHFFWWFQQEIVYLQRKMF